MKPPTPKTRQTTETRVRILGEWCGDQSPNVARHTSGRHSLNARRAAEGFPQTAAHPPGDEGPRKPIAVLESTLIPRGDKPPNRGATYKDRNTGVGTVRTTPPNWHAPAKAANPSDLIRLTFQHHWQHAGASSRLPRFGPFSVPQTLDHATLRRRRCVFLGPPASCSIP